MLDPWKLAADQLARDRARLAAYPHLLPHKIERMAASPLAFLRGAAPLFYDIVSAAPELAGGGPNDGGGRGWIAGDLHLENFGVFRCDAPADDENDRVSFHVNDFDDAVLGPWRYDLVRLATSVLLGARMIDGRQALALLDALLDGYAATVFLAEPTGPPPPPVAQLLDRVAGRKREVLLAARTVLDGNERRFSRGPRYLDLTPSLMGPARATFAAYVASLPPELRAHADAFEVVDLAFRVAGNGSLGSLRIAVLVRGKGGKNGHWIFDMKEEADPSAARLVGAPPGRPAVRVEAAMRATLPHLPRMVGTTELEGKSMLVRRLAPQEDRVRFDRVAPEELPAVVGYLGRLIGDAHRRGVDGSVPAGFASGERDAMRRGAVVIAGLHEAAYLAYLDLAR
jgi:uncharacterized protein (DUF2252 family)